MEQDGRDMQQDIALEERIDRSTDEPVAKTEDQYWMIRPDGYLNKLNQSQQEKTKSVYHLVQYWDTGC